MILGWKKAKLESEESIDLNDKKIFEFWLEFDLCGRFIHKT